MSILRLLFELFILYFLYTLIFNFIIPIYKATKQVKEKLNKMQQNDKKNQQYCTSHNSYRNNKEDYVEFEEVK